MKKYIYIALLVLFAHFTITACHRHEQEAVTKIIAVNLKANQTYTYFIPPTCDMGDVLQITQPPRHALTNTLAFTKNTTISPFQYIPVLNFTGTDEVQVATTGHNHHMVTTYIFKITVTP